MQGADAAQGQPCLEWPSDRAVPSAVLAEPIPQLATSGVRGGDDCTEEQIGVPGEILRDRVDDDIRSVGDRLLLERCRKSVVAQHQRALLAR